MSGALLVFGQTGQLAQELARIAPDARFLGRTDADLRDPEACAKAIRHTAPRAVINAAAYTAVDRAEAEEALALRINAEAPAAMAAACAVAGIPFVQVSTDYVFDGTGNAPWATDATPGPLGTYGRTKHAGEAAVRAAGGVHAILRTSWVFSARGHNFLRTMLRLGAERAEIAVVADQIGGPTPADALAEACLAIATQLAETPAKSGTYHFAGTPDISWAGFAREIFAQANLPCAVRDIASADYPTPAPRPANSRLDCAATMGAFGLMRPDWRQGVARVLAQITAGEGTR
ncbi:dTDP-4-dehydrorhamnose reductase [Phaeovulum sp.]|uniref:dTDP-4-dehydrorhamnose reductase n=1 Tax=Phaeovulum sp. TaxID=2934796 RepID=UPI0035636C1F